MFVCQRREVSHSFCSASPEHFDLNRLCESLSVLKVMTSFEPVEEHGNIRSSFSIEKVQLVVALMMFSVSLE